MPKLLVLVVQSTLGGSKGDDSTRFFSGLQENLKFHIGRKFY